MLPPESVAQIEAAWGDVMMSVGYQLVSDAQGKTTLVHQEKVHQEN